MAVALDAQGTQKSGAGVTTLSLTTFTVGTGTDRAIGVELISKTALTSLVLQWDSAGTPQTVALVKSQASVNGQVAALYGLVNPTSGNKTLKATWTGSNEACMNIVAVTGADQTGGATTFQNSAAATGNSSAPSVSVTSAVGNFCMSAVATGSLQGINSVSAIQVMLFHGAGTIEGGGSRAAGAASVTMTGTLAGTDQWAIVGMDILASGGTPFTAKFRKTLSSTGNHVGGRQVQG